MKVLVTGGAGYVGSVLVEKLLRYGQDVTVLDNFRWGGTPLAHLCHHEELEIIRGDAREASIVGPLVAKADVIIPLAALVGAPLCDADRTGAITTNLGAVQTIIKFASPQQRIIYPNTNSGYGVGAPGQECDEETPLRPISLYGVTKCDAEKAVLDRENSITFRLATVFGFSPRMRLDLLVNDFVHRAVNDRTVVLFESHFKRNYVHVRDVSRAFIHAIQNFADMKGRPYNVGLSDANLSKLELCEKIKQRVPPFVFMEAATHEDPDKRDYVVSNARIETTGFRPWHSLDDGIVELMKGFQMLRNARYSNV